MLIVQLMMIKDEECLVKENIRKAYYFLKQHEELIKRTSTEYTFLSRVEISSLLQIIEEELVQTVKR